jgi:GntR family transcriptional regulator/MocR family aminotransferase
VNTNYKFSLDKIRLAYTTQQNSDTDAKYIVLYRAIKNTITSHELPANWLLPSTRVLSKALNISRTTVNKSYELLQLEKLISSKIGSGFRVSYNLSSEFTPRKRKHASPCKRNYPNISEKGIAFTENITLVNKISNTNLAFRPGVPPIDVFPVNRWKNLLNNYWRHIKSSNLSYSSATGLEELKKSIADYLNISRNIRCDFEQIVVVSGSLQSLYLIATTLIDKGDEVILENPIFPNVHSVFKSSQAKLTPLAIDDEGIKLSQLNQQKAKPKIIHVTPSNHYPMGIKMSVNRRQELLNWASEHNTIIIENDYEHEIANHDQAIPSIYSLDQEDRTIYMGTFNRLLHPSIRLGYMIVPRYLIKTVQALQEHSHRFVSPSIQVVMNQFIEKNYLYQHIKTCIDIANERYELFCREFEKISKKMTIEKKQCSSFHLVATFHEPDSIQLEKTVLAELESKNITAHALSKCYIDAPKTYGLIFGYAAVRPSVLKKKIQTMKGIL